MIGQGSRQFTACQLCKERGSFSFPAVSSVVCGFCPHGCTMVVTPLGIMQQTIQEKEKGKTQMSWFFEKVLLVSLFKSFHLNFIGQDCVIWTTLQHERVWEGEDFKLIILNFCFERRKGNGCWGVIFPPYLI